MAEHEPQSAPIDEDAIAEVLGTRSATVHDVAYGEGHQFSLGRGDARLEVFPRTGVTRRSFRWSLLTPPPATVEAPPGWVVRSLRGVGSICRLVAFGPAVPIAYPDEGKTVTERPGRPNARRGGIGRGRGNDT